MWNSCLSSNGFGLCKQTDAYKATSHRCQKMFEFYTSAELKETSDPLQNYISHSSSCMFHHYTCRNRPLPQLLTHRGDRGWLSQDTSVNISMGTFFFKSVFVGTRPRKIGNRGTCDIDFRRLEFL